MAQQIINTGANANDGTGEPLREAFTAVNDNFTEIYTAGPVGSNVQIVGNTITTLQINQNLTLKPNGIGKIQANTTIIPSVNLVYDLGSTTQQWDSVYAGYFIGNGSLLTGIVGGNASNGFSTISANGVAIIANSSTGVLTLTPGNNITIVGSAGSDTVTFGVSSSPVFSGNVTGSNILTGGTVSAAGNVTGANLRTTGSVSAAYFSGNGSQLTSVTGANVVGIVPRANIANVAYSVAAANIVGNIANATYSEYANLAYYAFGDGIVGQISTTSTIIGGNISATSNVTGAYILGNGSQLTGVVATNVGVLASLSVTGNAQIGNVRTAGQVSATGNVTTGNYFVGNGAFLTGIVATAGSQITNGQSNVRIGGANANVTIGVNTVSNVAVFTTDGMSTTGTIIANANVLANGQISAVGNVTGNYIFGNGALLTGVITSVANINNGTSNVTVVSSGGNVTVGIGGIGNVAVFASTGEYVTGLISATGNITGNNLAGETLTINSIASDDSSYISIEDGLNVFGEISAVGNIMASTFVGNGVGLTSTLVDRGEDLNNWNTITQMGVYTVNRTSWAGTSNTPLDSQVFVGLLEVKNSMNMAIEQIFYPGTIDNTNVKMQWARAYWSGVWTPWVLMTNDGQTLSGGEFS